MDQRWRSKMKDSITWIRHRHWPYSIGVKRIIWQLFSSSAPPIELANNDKRSTTHSLTSLVSLFSELTSTGSWSDPKKWFILLIPIVIPNFVQKFRKRREYDPKVCNACFRMSPAADAKTAWFRKKKSVRFKSIKISASIHNEFYSGASEWYCPQSMRHIFGCRLRPMQKRYDFLIKGAFNALGWYRHWPKRTLEQEASTVWTCVWGV